MSIWDKAQDLIGTIAGEGQGNINLNQLGEDVAWEGKTGFNYTSPDYHSGEPTQYPGYEFERHDGTGFSWDPHNPDNLYPDNPDSPYYNPYHDIDGIDDPGGYYDQFAGGNPLMDAMGSMSHPTRKLTVPMVEDYMQTGGLM